MDKVIQITNIYPNSKFKNQQRGRIYLAKGCAPCLTGMGGRRFRTEILMDNVKKKICVRTHKWGGKDKGGNGTLSFHVNTYFGCVTATKFNNRETWIVEIQSNSLT